MNRMEKIRAFIAIELPEKLKEELAGFEASLKKSDTTGCAKWVSPESIHITLRFLGAVEADKIEDIEKAMTEACRGVPPFSLCIAGCGCFPGPRRMRVIWVGVGGEVDKLIRLQRQTDERLKPLGFEPEARAYTPHLTLSRIRELASPEETARLGKALEGAKPEFATEVEVKSVSLMKSQLTPQGAIYTCLFRAPLEESEGK